MPSWITEKTNWIPSDSINLDVLDRIENNSGVVSDFLASIGYYPSIVIKTDWGRTDIPKRIATKKIVDNIAYLGSIYETPPFLPSLPVLPLDMRNIKYDGMNAIESYLKILYDYLQKQKNSLRYCGELICGQEYSAL